MQIVSVSVGAPREVEGPNGPVRTSIFKSPVTGPVRAANDNLEGDRQSDLRVHGGPLKAVYAYPSEHYAFWRAELPGVELPWGSFGENLTTLGLTEDAARIGDRYRIGTVELVVTQPRRPCFKLGIRFGRPDIIERFLASGRSGMYLAIATEGTLAAGDAIERVGRGAAAVTIADVVRLDADSAPDPDLLARAIAAEALPASWRERFLKRLDGLRA